MSPTGRYYWDRLATAEQAALLGVQRAQVDHLHLGLLNALVGYGLVEWLTRHSDQMHPVLSQRGASAIAHWRRAS